MNNNKIYLFLIKQNNNKIYLFLMKQNNNNNNKLKKIIK